MRRVSRLLFHGWGRLAAWAMLAVFVLLQLFAPDMFERPRLALFDLYQERAPRLAHESPVVIVAIDEASLKSVGQWPWPRQRLGELVTKILAGRPAALGLDMIMPETDRSSPQEWVRDAGDIPVLLREAVKRLPSHDAQLAEAMSKGPVMIGVGGLRPERDQPDNGPLAPFRLKDAGGATTTPPMLPTFNAGLRSVGVIDAAARGHGFISVDADTDGVFRRLPLVSVLSNRLAPSMAIEMLRLTAKAQWVELSTAKGAVLGVGVGPLAIPTQADGSVWIHFSPHDPTRYVPAADVLSGKVDPTAFEQRIVLVSVTGLGITDLRLTSVGFMPGTELSAQLIENVLDGKLVERPRWTHLLEAALTALFGVFLIVVLKLPRVPWQLLLTVGVAAVLVGIGFWFWQSLTLVDVATPIIGQALVFLSFLAANSAEAEAQRRQLRRELEARKLALAKADLANATVRAPFDGVVGNRTVQNGQFVRAGVQVMAVVPLPDIYVVANFKETQIAHMVPGLPVRLSIDALPDVDLKGHIESFAPASGSLFSLLPPENATGNFTKVVQRIPVRIRVEGKPNELALLRAGMSTAVTVDIRDKPKSDAIEAAK